jgi:hypothetical protein
VPSARERRRPKRSATLPVGTSSRKFQNMNQAFSSRIRPSEIPPQSRKNGTRIAAMVWSQ